jgi:ribosome-binding factor A
VADLLRDEMAGFLRSGLEEAPGALVTITDVELGADLSLARVYVSVFPDSADGAAILEALERRRGRWRHDLGKALHLKRIPDLDFRLDDTARRSQRIEDLLRDRPPGSGEEGGGD